MNQKRDKSLSEKTYDLLKKKILLGELNSESSVSVNALAESLDISRSPITNACQKLESEGLIKIIPKQGIIINELTLEDARDLYELRVVIETYAIEHSFESFTDKDIKNLEENLIKQKEYVSQENIEKFMEKDIEFHRYILKKYTNQEFITIFNSAYDRMFFLGIENLKNPKRLMDNIKEHERIVNSLKTENKKETLKAIEDNILNGYRYMTGIGEIKI